MIFLVALMLTAPVDVFSDLDGEWRGEFAGYSVDGEELYRIQVEQRYETVDENTQRVEIRDTATDGTVVTGKGFNRAVEQADGSIELTCVVDKSNGDHVEHRGRILTSVSGDKVLVWFSDKTGRRETFHERVFESKGKTVYEIRGAGLYGTSLIFMHGHYRKSD